MDDVLSPEPAAPAPVRGGTRNILQVFWQRRGFILLGLVAGGTFGLLNYSQRSPVYRASAQILVVKKQAAKAARPAASESACAMEGAASPIAAAMKSLIADLRARGHERLVTEIGSQPGPRLDDHLLAESDQLSHGRRRRARTCR